MGSSNNKIKKRLTEYENEEERRRKKKKRKYSVDEDIVDETTGRILASQLHNNSNGYSSYNYNYDHH